MALKYPDNIIKQILQIFKPTRIFPKPTQIYPKPTRIHPKPTRIFPKPTQIHPKPTQIHPKPTQIHPKPTQIHPKPTQIHPKPTQIHPKPTHIYPKPTPKACGVQVEDDPGIKVGSLHTYVIGSYMDHRFNVKQIKMIAIVLRDEKVTYRCVMCCEGRNVTSPAEYTIHYDHFDFEYGTATITCQIHSSCSTPTHVALTASEISDSITSFQPIRNRDVPTVFPYSFTVCISVMYDYENVLGLVQAMEMFRLLGAQRVVIYKTNCDSDIQKVLDYYVKSGFVEIIPWTIKKHINVSNGWRKSDSPGQLHYYGQIPALNDCVYRYMYQSRYLALHDMDEFILPLKVKSWTDLLRELENTYGTNVGFEFENNIFPCTAKPDYGQTKWKNVRGMNILNCIEREVPISLDNFKIIVNPRLVLRVNVHGIEETVKHQRYYTVRVQNSIARMYHIKSYSTNTKLVRDDHLNDYAGDLVPAVSKVLQDCGFINE
ncbi:glycosyltransferase family 92 protein [Pimephales promelas]|nr:glycosyltransferase family 92 protein [Pimephales promelas]